MRPPKTEASDPADEPTPPRPDLFTRRAPAGVASRRSRRLRALRLLLDAEDALAGARSSGELLGAACRLVVELGGFRLAVAGLADGPCGRKATSLRRVAHRGNDDDPGAVERAWAWATAAPGLASTALRTRAPAVSNDLRSDARVAASGEDLAEPAPAAAAALPIALADERPCVLLVVSARQDDFDEITVRALQRLAGDVARRLATLRMHALLAGVVDHVPASFWMVTSDGRYALVNRAWEDATGRSRGEVLGRSLEEVFPAETARHLREANARALEAGRAVRADEEVLLRGEARALETVIFPVGNTEPGSEVIAGFSVDVTERRRSEDRLRFQARLIEEISDAVIATDAEGRITYANGAAIARYAPGASAADVLGRGLEDFYEYRWSDPGARERAWRTLVTSGAWRGEVVHARRDGVSWPIDASVVALKDDAGRPAGFFAVLRDVSERKASEDERRASREELRALALRLQSVREEEKARIARDLHDELGQLVTALRLVFSEIERRLEAEGAHADGAVVDRVVAASELLDRTGASIRRIASELRPGVLDQLGLAAALEQEVQRFARHTGIPCSVRPWSDAPELPPEIATALYRIAQESLTNVARHARASRVDLVLAVRPGEVTLVVEDDGCGLPAAPAGRRGLGVLGMQERASALGGEARVAPREGGGTRVTATIPVPPASTGTHP